MLFKVIQGIGDLESRSPILVPIQSPYATFFVSIIPTFILYRTVSEIWQIIGPLFAVDRECLSLTHSFRFRIAKFCLKKLENFSISFHLFIHSFIHTVIK